MLRRYHPIGILCIHVLNTLYFNNLTIINTDAIMQLVILFVVVLNRVVYTECILALGIGLNIFLDRIFSDYTTQRLIKLSDSIRFEFIT
jgi:hypothetical protein